VRKAIAALLVISVLDSVDDCFTDASPNPAYFNRLRVLLVRGLSHVLNDWPDSVATLIRPLRCTPKHNIVAHGGDVATISRQFMKANLFQHLSRTLIPWVAHRDRLVQVRKRHNPVDL